LYPEASILLIMDDLGWDGGHRQLGTEWEAARKKAEKVWNASREYGRWRFRDDTEEGKRVLRDARRRKAETREMVRQGREVQKQRTEGRNRGKGQKATGGEATRIVRLDDCSEDEVGTTPRKKRRKGTVRSVSDRSSSHASPAESDAASGRTATSTRSVNPDPAVDASVTSTPRLPRKALQRV
jgi:hypothetical protein